MAVHFITWSPDELGEKKRFRARYTQALSDVIEQAEHDRDVNNRVNVKIEDTKGKIVWPKEK